MPPDRNLWPRSDPLHPAYRFDRPEEPAYPGSTRADRYMAGHGYVTMETRTPQGMSSGDSSSLGRGGFEQDEDDYYSLPGRGRSYRDLDSNSSDGAGPPSYRDRDYGFAPAPRSGARAYRPPTPYYAESSSDEETAVPSSASTAHRRQRLRSGAGSPPASVSSSRRTVYPSDSASQIHRSSTRYASPPRSHRSSNSEGPGSRGITAPRDAQGRNQRHGYIRQAFGGVFSSSSRSRSYVRDSSTSTASRSSRTRSHARDVSPRDELRRQQHRAPRRDEYTVEEPESD
jgi:hypothetical protein